MTKQERIQSALEYAIGVPFTAGNTVKALRNGEEIFPVMIAAMRQAEREIAFLTFVYWTGRVADEFARTMADRARSGVKVRCLIDAFGGKSLSDENKSLMQDAGVDLRFFRPFKRWDLSKSDNRTHRKILVCDGAVGFTGGVGIASQWEGDAGDPTSWRDTHFEIRGPAVFSLYGAFVGDWVEAGDREVPFLTEQLVSSHEGTIAAQCVTSDGLAGGSKIAILQETLIRLAQKELIIITPYFAPKPKSSDLLVDALKRGVRVQIMIPGPHVDKEFSELAGADTIRQLLDAGAQIHIYQKTMLHQKLILIDGIASCIGSANFNRRSIEKDNEAVVTFICRELAELLRDDFEQDLNNCEPANADDWHNRSSLRRMREWIASFFSAEV